MPMQRCNASHYSLVRCLLTLATSYVGGQVATPAAWYRPRMKVLGLCIVGVATSCTTLGPMPTTMGVSAMPAGRPEVSVTTHVLPGYYLSSTVTADHKGTSIPGASMLFEPDRIVEVPGLIVGARAYGSENTGFEPMLGYRRRIGPHAPLAYGAVVAFTRASGKANGAEYEATRVSGEVVFEYRMLQTEYVDLGITAAVNGTALSAEAAYCVDAQGFGHDCGDMEMTIAGKASGLYVAGTAGVALDIGHRVRGPFHGVRASVTGSFGSLPTVIGGVQKDATSFYALGLNIGLNFGASK